MPTKTYDGDKDAWRVEFRLPEAAGVQRAWVCGEFNDWSREATPMETAPDGGLRAVVWLDPGRYRFRYYLGDDEWENDWAADDYVANEHGGTDSVLEVPADPGEGDGDADEARQVAVDEGSAQLPDADAASEAGALVPEPPPAAVPSSGHTRAKTAAGPPVPAHGEVASAEQLSEGEKAVGAADANGRSASRPSRRRVKPRAPR